MPKGKRVATVMDETGSRLMLKAISMRTGKSSQEILREALSLYVPRLDGHVKADAYVIVSLLAEANDARRARISAIRTKYSPKRTRRAKTISVALEGVAPLGL